MKILNFNNMFIFNQVLAEYLDGSIADGITVSLDVTENEESFFKQNILSDSNGVVVFTVPALPHTAKTVTVKVRIIVSLILVCWIM